MNGAIVLADYRVPEFEPETEPKAPAQWQRDEPTSFVIYDDPNDGGDGTFLTPRRRDLWSIERARARVFDTHEDAAEALESVDCGRLLRHRLHIVPAECFGFDSRAHRIDLANAWEVRTDLEEQSGDFARMRDAARRTGDAWHWLALPSFMRAMRLRTIGFFPAIHWLEVLRFGPLAERAYRRGRSHARAGNWSSWVEIARREMRTQRPISLRLRASSGKFGCGLAIARALLGCVWRAHLHRPTRIATFSRGS